MATCTKGSCQDEAASDSVRCPKHRDEQKARNAKYQGRSSAAATRSYTKRQPTQAVSNGDGSATDLDAAIVRLESQLAVLREAKTILEVR